MSEMVERVARAICKSAGLAPDERSRLQDKAIWELFEQDARAVIVAMREPTEAMIEEGDNVAWPDEGKVPEIYRAMIDEALRDDSDERDG